LRNEAFETLWQAADRSYVRELVGIVAGEATGVVAGVTGSTAEGDAIDLELLLLPLRHRGNTHARQFGVLAPLSLPYWLGSSPVEALALGAHRHIGSDIDEKVAAGRFAPFRAGHPRHRFIVYDGGRSDP
jgi:hypothetical protein